MCQNNLDSCDVHHVCYAKEVVVNGNACSSICAGDPSGSGGLQISSAEGVAQQVPFSVFSGSTLLTHDIPCAHSEVFDGSLSDPFLSIDYNEPVAQSEIVECSLTECLFSVDCIDHNTVDGDTPPCLLTTLTLSCEVSSDLVADPPFVSGDVTNQDGDHNTVNRPVSVELSPREYYFDTEPVFCMTQFIDEVGVIPIYHRVSSRSVYVDGRGIEWSRPCVGDCAGVHYVGGLRSQLNPCVFFDYCFGNPSDDNGSYIFQGVSEGFRIVDPEYEGSYFCSNYDSVLHPSAKAEMDEIVRKELRLDKVSLVDSIPTCVHALGAIHKSDGGIRPITDCRRPLSRSINNYMEHVCETFSYVSLDQVCEVVEPGSYFSVLDIRSAYRSVNVYPPHTRFQGFMWDLDGYGLRPYVDNCLCFGLKSAPYIYTQITEFVMRTMSRLGYQNVFGYLDDFIVVAPTELECKRVMSRLIDLLQELGFVIAWKKVVPPSQVITYLGIQIDSISMSLTLPSHKVIKLKSLVNEFKDKVTCTVKNLQVLAGHLAHASSVVRGGRTFSRRVINLLKYVSGENSVIRLPDWFKEDLAWWIKFIDTFNGAAYIISDLREHEVPIETDSSMTGFGARWGSHWFLGVWHLPFPPPGFPTTHWSSPPASYSSSLNINVLELWPVVLSAHRWGKFWKDRKVRLYTDNTQVMSMINTGRSSSTECMFWLRELFWVSVLYNFHIVASYVRSSDNVVPDFLSRFFDVKRRASIPPHLTWDLCCYRSGRVKDPIVCIPEKLVS